MNMREKMAMALKDALHGDDIWKWVSADGRWVAPDILSDSNWQYAFFSSDGGCADLRKLADAAIDALMEPTEGMCDAACDRYRELAKPPIDGDMGAVVYLAAIRAAKDGK